jgi:hypothetical protein
MVFSFLYLVVRALLGALVRSRRGLHLKDVELLVLRHELEILRRQVARPKLRMVDRGATGGGSVSPAALVAWRASCDAADTAALASGARSPEVAAAAESAWPPEAA